MEKFKEQCPNQQKTGLCHFMKTGCQFAHFDAEGNLLPKMNKLSLKDSFNSTSSTIINAGLQPSLLPRPPSSAGSSTPTSSSSSAIPNLNESAKKKFNFSKVSSFVPSNTTQSPVMSSVNLTSSISQPNPTNSAKNVGAAPFTPNGEFEPQGGYMGSPVMSSPYALMGNDHQQQLQNGIFVPQQQGQQSQAPQPNMGDLHSSFIPSLQTPNTNPGTPGIQQGGPSSHPSYFHPHSNPNQMQNPFTVLNYHLYSPAPPPNNNTRLHGNSENVDSMFIPSKLREKLNRKNEATLKSFPGGWQNLLVGTYFDPVPLDTITEPLYQESKQQEQQTYSGFKTSLFKFTNNNDGKRYTLRRLEQAADVIGEKNFTAAVAWKGLKHHANIVSVKDVFSTRAFNDHSLIIVYDFYPNAKTLDEYHINPKTGVAAQVTESHLWTYLVQLSSGIAAVHESNLAVRSMDLKKVILTSDNRVRFSDCGVTDILEYDGDEDSEKLKALQIEDLEKLGRLILSLVKQKSGISSPSTKNTLETDLQYLESSTIIKEDLKNALKYLLIPSEEKSIFEFQKSITSKIIKEFNNMQSSADYYESQLTREVENARLVRLLTKLNFVIFRTTSNTSPQAWKPSGEKYALTLFHSYVFHQVDANGKPVLDLSHVLRCLNKLDVGVDEKILLVSEDEQNFLILSYKEIKQLIERNYRALCT